MTSNETQTTETRSNRENQASHSTIIGKSIGRIVGNTKNEHFKIETSKQLNVKFERRKKTIQTETMKLLKNNYQ